MFPGWLHESDEDDENNNDDDDEDDEDDDDDEKEDVVDQDTGDFDETEKRVNDELELLLSPSPGSPIISKP